jgi:hypothetical protein
MAHEGENAMMVKDLQACVEQLVINNTLWPERVVETNYIAFEGSSTVRLDGLFHLCDLRAIVAALDVEALLAVMPHTPTKEVAP